MSELIFKKITFRNFLSIGNVAQTIDLSSKDVLTLIYGYDKDVSQDTEARNGTGKTTIINAISYALFGFPISNINLPKLVNDSNKKNMQVILEFERFGNRYRIERGKKPDYFRYYVNGQGGDIDENQETQGTKRSTQITIEQDVLKFSYNVLRNVIILNTYTDPFLRMPGPKQREIIEELFGITQLTTKANRLKEKIKDTKDLIKQEETQIKAFQETNNKLEKSIIDIEVKSKVWETNHKNKITNIVKNIDELSGINYQDEITKFDKIEEYNENVKTIEHEIKSIQQNIEQLKNKKLLCNRELQLIKSDPNYEKNVQTLTNEKSRITKEQTVLNDKLSETEKLIHTLEHQLQEPDNLDCKTCGQNLRDTTHQHVVIEKIQDHLKRTEKEKHSYQSSLEQIIKRLNTINVDIENLHKNNKLLIEKLEKDTLIINEKIKEYDLNINEKSETLQTFTDALQNYEKPEKSVFKSKDDAYKTLSYFEQLNNDLNKEQNQINPFIDQLESMREMITPIVYNTINELSIQKQHQEFLLDLLTKKDSVVRRKLINQNLLYLNKRLNFWLEQLSLPHEVIFQDDATSKEKLPDE